MKVHPALHLALAIFFLGALSGCGPAPWGAEKVFLEESKSFSPSGIDAVWIATRSGKIEIAGSREEKIVLRTIRKAQASSRADAEALLKKVRVAEGKEGSAWKISADLPPAASSEEAAVDFYLTIPSRMNLQLETHHGEATVLSVEGKLQMRMHNGALTVRGSRDAVRARSSNGEIRIEGNPSSIDLASHNGSIEVMLGDLRSFEKESAIETHNGEIVFAAPAGFSANLHASCGNGEVRVDTPGRWERSALREIRGAMGTGGAKLRMGTHNGKILVKERR